MLKIELSWQDAAVTSACLLGTTAAIRLGGVVRRRGGRRDGGAAVRDGGAAVRDGGAAVRDGGAAVRDGGAAVRDGGAAAGDGAAPRRSRFAGAVAIAQESGVVVGLFALWQFAGRYATRIPGGALARARWIWHAERVIGLPSEAAVQRLFLPYPLVVQAFNLYYASLHFVVLIAMLAWVFLRHRDRYAEVRGVLVMLTGACLAIQLIPVAPPRMLPLDGMVDTAVRYGQSVYGSFAGFNADEVSAMPSVHVAWALLVGITVVRVSASRWRWLALAYPAMTTLVVVVTANHYWADGIVAGVLLALSMLAWDAGAAARRALRRRLRPRLGGSPEPEPEPAWLASQDTPMSPRGTA
jgi:hypothetical protein